MNGRMNEWMNENVKITCMCREIAHNILTFKSLAVSLCTTGFNIYTFYMVLALHWVFCMDLRTGSDFCFVHH